MKVLVALYFVVVVVFVEISYRLDSATENFGQLLCDPQKYKMIAGKVRSLEKSLLKIVGKSC